MKDTVIVTGNIKIPHKEAIIMVEILDSQGNRIGEESLTNKENFREGFLIDSDTWSVGQYTAKISLIEREYKIDERGVLERTGNYVPIKMSGETKTFDVIPFSLGCGEGFYENEGTCYEEIEFSSAPIEDPRDDRIKELEDKITSLETEISRLNTIIETMQNQINSMIQEFTASTIQLNEWFRNQLSN